MVRPLPLTRLVLGQFKTDAKSKNYRHSGITGTPRYKGCLVIDAMGCQTEIASTIVKGGGDYLLAVKVTNPLHNAVRAVLRVYEEAAGEETLSVETGNRIDITALPWLYAVLAEQFQSGKALVLVYHNHPILKIWKNFRWIRYYISSQTDTRRFSSNAPYPGRLKIACTALWMS